MTVTEQSVQLARTNAGGSARGPYLDAERAAAGEVGVPSTRHVAVCDGCRHRRALEAGPAVAFVAELDAGVRETRGVAALDACGGRVVRVLRGDIARDDARAVVDRARIDGRPVERDCRGIKGAR